MTDQTIREALALLADAQTKLESLLKPVEPPQPNGEGITQIGIPWVNKASSELWYQNIAKQFGEWVTEKANHTAKDLPEYADEHGWFKQIPPGEPQVKTMLSFSDMLEEELGDYVIEFDGDCKAGDVEVALSATVTGFERIEGRNILRINVHHLGPVNLVVRNIRNTDDHPRNFVMHKDDPAWKARLDAGFVFTEKVVNAFKEMRPGILRFMDAMRTNGSEIREPEDYPKVTDAVWSNQMPLEVMVALCKEVGAAPQWQTPFYASDRFIQHLAKETYRLLGDKYHHGAFSNETFNTFFPQTNDVNVMAIRAWGEPESVKIDGRYLYSSNPVWADMRGKLIAVGDEPNQYKVAAVEEDAGIYKAKLSRVPPTQGETTVIRGDWWGNSMHAKLSCHHSKVYREAWPGSPENVCWHMEGVQASDRSSEERMLGTQWKEMDPDNWVDPQDWHDQLDITGYFGHAISADVSPEPDDDDDDMDWLFAPDGIAWTDEAEAFKQLRDYLLAPGSRHGLERWVRKITSRQMAIKGLRKPVGYYENSAHMVGAPNKRKPDYMERLAFLIRFQDSKEFAEVMAAQFDMIRELGVKCFTLFRLFALTKGAYDFSVVDHIGRDVPALRVLREKIQQTEPWW